MAECQVVVLLKGFQRDGVLLIQLVSKSLLCGELLLKQPKLHFFVLQSDQLRFKRPDLRSESLDLDAFQTHCLQIVKHAVILLKDSFHLLLEAD